MFSSVEFSPPFPQIIEPVQAILVPPKASWFFRNTNVINLDIALLDSFVSRTTNILAHVEIGRQDSWKSIGDGRGREVSVIAASLHGKAIPQGVRYVDFTQLRPLIFAS